MKLKFTQAVAFLVALGFAKAANWDVAKITDRLSQVPGKVTKDQVPEGQEDLYDALVAASGKVTLTDLPAPAAVEEKAPKAEKKAKEKKPAKEEAPPVEEKPAKAEKKAKKVPLREGKPAKPLNPVKEVPKDQYGCREGTISALVNKQVSKEWKTEQEIAEEAGVSLDQARGRLYYAAEEGIFERERLVRYRIPKAVK